MKTPNNPLQDSAQEITTIAKEAGIVFVGTIIGTGLRYLFRAIIGRLLGPAQVGLYFIGLGIFRISERLACLGVQNGILRYVPLYKGEKDESRVKGTIILAVRIVLISGILGCLLVVLFSPLISLRFYDDSQLIGVLRFFSIALPFSALTVVFVFSMQGFRILKYKVMVRELFEPLSRILFFICLFFLGWRLFGALFSFVISTAVGTILAFFFLKKVYPKILDKHTLPIYETKKLVGFSWPLFFVGFFYIIILWINTLLIGYFLHSKDAGIFGAAHTTAILGQVVLNSFVSIFAPIVSDLHNRGEKEKLENLYKVVTKWIFTLSFPLFVIMIHFAEEILNLSFGKNFVEGTTPLILISIGFLINSILGSAGFLTSMSGRPKFELANLTVVFMINVVFCILFIPKYGITGAAYATLISFVVLNIMRIVEVYFLFKMHPFELTLYKPLLAGGISFMTLMLTAKYFSTRSDLILLLVGSAIFCCVYCLILFLLGFNEEDKVVLAKIREKTKLF